MFHLVLGIYVAGRHVIVISDTDVAAFHSLSFWQDTSNGLGRN